MDVFSRISKAIGGTASNPQTSNGASSVPSKPLEKGHNNSKRAAKKSIAGEEHGGADAFKDNWRAIQASLLTPDQAALHHGLGRTDVAERLQDLSDALVSEANRSDEDNEIAGPCMEAFLEGDLLGRLVKLTANDRVAGSQAEVVRLFASLIILLDERFLSRQAVHRPLVRLMRICVGDELFNSSSRTSENDNEDEEIKAWRRFGRDGSAEMLGFEEDLVDMMCHVASRLRNTPELLIIFFRDRGGDAEAKRAFNRALTGSASPSSMPGSRTSTRPTSPSGSINSSATIKATMPAISSPLRPLESLPIPPRSRETDTASNVSTSSSLTYDFPLFSYLLRFVHRESRTGELARAGLLFLVDVAFAPGRRNIGRSKRREGVAARGQQSARGVRGGGSMRKVNATARVRIDVDYGVGPSLALAKYMLDSDFAEVLGASLGAVYGLLPSKIAASRQSTAQEKEDGSGMSLGGSILPNIEAETLHQRGIELNTSDEVRKQAKLLCDLLEFTQDILRTTSRMPRESIEGEDKKRTSFELSNVAQSLTASIGSSIQKLYLENILYPSLLECSDLDGSAVAVMTYLDLILGVLESDGALAEYIIGWLVGKENQETSSASQSSDRLKKHKSTAMIQLEKERGKRKEKSDYFSDAIGRYTVKDLILDYLKTSVKPEAVIASLNLASTIVIYHGRFTLQNVLQVAADDTATGFPSNWLAPHQHGEDEEEGDDDSEEFVYPGASKEDELFEEKLKQMTKRAVGGVTILEHAREMNLYLSLVTLVEKGVKEVTEERLDHESLSPQGAFESNSSTGFDNYLEEAEQGLIRDSLFWEGIRSLEEDGREVEEDEDSQSCYRHKVVPQDPLLRALLANLCHFWQNSPEVNVALTGFIAALSLCPMRSLEGLVVFSRETEEQLTVNGTSSEPIAGTGEEEDDRSDDEKEYQFKASQKKKRHKSKSSSTSHSSSTPPILLCILRSLVSVLDHYRPEVSGFDRLLRERRKGLLYVENLSEALQLNEENVSGEEIKGLEVIKGARYELPEASIKKLWENVKVDAEVVEIQVSGKSGSRKKQISLPPPPSATSVFQHESTKEVVQAPVPIKREGFARFFGRSNATKTTAAKASTDGSTEATEKPPTLVPQPFAQHYQETSSIYLTMDRLRLSSKSQWSNTYQQAEEKTKAKEKRTRFKDIDGDSDEDNVMYPGAEEEEEEKSKAMDASEVGRDLVNLSSLLDNAVILEEFIKEMAAILQIRRANGVDTIRFV